jgi:hypothetical protein
MMGAESLPSRVEDEEKLSRFILFRGWFRPSNNTVKQDAFTPSGDLDVSVTRQRGFSEEQIWRRGQEIADARPAPLYGRADFQAAQARAHSLDVRSDEPPPNHALIVSWPIGKAQQKMIALELAALSLYIPNPGTTARS